MNEIEQMILNVLVRQDAIDVALTGRAVGIMILADYIALLLASVVGLAVIIERSFRLRRRRLLNKRVVASLMDRLGERDLSGAVEVCERSGTLLARAFAEELNEHRAGRISMEEAVETAGQIVEQKLNTNLDILTTVAKIGPLLGLLGTVLGMIYAFGQIDMVAKKETLAQGIVTALDTTVRGLIIAIVALIAERHFNKRINLMIAEFNHVFTRLIRMTKGQA